MPLEFCVEQTDQKSPYPISPPSRYSASLRVVAVVPPGWGNAILGLSRYATGFVFVGGNHRHPTQSRTSYVQSRSAGPIRLGPLPLPA